MKGIIISMLIVLGIASCTVSKEYDCICILTVTEDGGAPAPAGSVNNTLYGKKKDVKVKCKAQERGYTQAIDQGPYIQYYTASCEIE